MSINRIGLDIKQSEELAIKLTDLLANYSVFYQNVRGYHWNITGEKFFELHVKFEEFYDEVNELYDAFAERLLMIGGSPVSNLKGYLAITSLKEASGSEKSDEMIGHILDDMKLLVTEFKEVLNVAQEKGDETTADMLITTIASFEKHIWMLSATLK